MIDIVTVVFDQELPVLRAQAQSIDLYCRNIGIENIYIVVNGDESLVHQIDSAWWGRLSGKVIVIPRSVFGCDWGHTGWVSQQALKMMTAAVSYNAWSMILDAKTVFVKELDLRELFDASVRPQVGQLDIYPVFDTSRAIVNQLFGIDMKTQLGPGGVPFFVNNVAVRGMIAEVESRTKQTFPQWFQDQGMVTEFILYSGYILFRYGNYNAVYNVDKSSVSPVNVCHSEVEAFDRKLAHMSQALTVSVHRHAWQNLHPDQRNQYQHFLIDRGVTEAWKL